MSRNNSFAGLQRKMLNRLRRSVPKVPSYRDVYDVNGCSKKKKEGGQTGRRG